MGADHEERVAGLVSGRWRVGAVAPEIERGFLRRAARLDVIARLQKVDGLDAGVAKIVEGDDRHAACVRQLDQAVEVVHRAERRIDAVAIDRVEAAEALAAVRRRKHLDRGKAGLSKIVERGGGARALEREPVSLLPSWPYPRNRRRRFPPSRRQGDAARVAPGSVTPSAGPPTPTSRPIRPTTGATVENRVEVVNE